ncbi:MAG TPA: BON domain-containing protein [Steroidobacteraceae bacterium]|jgi:osmotically-inducible protein OsmY|nr:BON domain-containing protein [Steroidobacteraceae bacterium]
MSSPFTSPFAGLCVCFGAVVFAAGAAHAQNVNSPSDAEVQSRVQQALHADRYFYDGHVDVAVDHGVVYLRGLVFSDWDLRDAKRIAVAAAGDRRVVDDLTLVEGGRR